jgi:hypothetical protein
MSRDLPDPKEVWAWVDEHMTRYAPTERVILSEFVFNWNRLGGYCTVEFDDVRCPDPLTVYYGDNGRISFCLPSFHSPLGAPASYAAYELSDAAEQAVREGLEAVFPKITAYGLNRITNVLTTASTPEADRLPPPDVMEAVWARLDNPTLTITVPIED